MLSACLPFIVLAWVCPWLTALPHECCFDASAAARALSLILHLTSSSQVARENIVRRWRHGTLVPAFKEWRQVSRLLPVPTCDVLSADELMRCCSVDGLRCSVVVLTDFPELCLELSQPLADTHALSDSQYAREHRARKRVILFRTLDRLAVSTLWRCVS